MLKRVVTRGGRNRIYVNGSLGPLALLANIGAGLIHIYGQHEQHTLRRTETHLALLDAHAGLEADAAVMKERFDAFAAAWKEVRELEEALAGKAREEAFLRAQAEEIEGAGLESGEDEALRRRREIIAHSERLYQTCRGRRAASLREATTRWRANWAGSSRAFGRWRRSTRRWPRR